MKKSWPGQRGRAGTVGDSGGQRAGTLLLATTITGAQKREFDLSR